MTWIQTFSGRRFDIANPKPESVWLEDIAHSLSMQCRYNGHCQHFYSVAEHSTYVAAIVCLAKLANLWLPTISYSPLAQYAVTQETREIAKREDAARLVRLLGAFEPLDVIDFGYQRLDSPDQAEVRSAFLHDAPEAYTKDLPTPIKRMCPEYRALEEKIESAVFSAFSLSAWLPLTPLVKAADHEILFVEKDALLRHDLNGWGNTIARDPLVEIFARSMTIRCLEPREAKGDFLRLADLMGIK